MDSSGPMANPTGPMNPGVPGHLRGKPVPDMTATPFVGAAPSFSSTDVGSVWNKGSLRIPEQKIDGSNFKLASPNVTQKGLKNTHNAMALHNEDAVGGGTCHHDAFKGGANYPLADTPAISMATQLSASSSAKTPSNLSPFRQPLTTFPFHLPRRPHRTASRACGGRRTYRPASPAFLCHDQADYPDALNAELSRRPATYSTNRSLDGLRSLAGDERRCGPPSEICQRRVHGGRFHSSPSC
jgi:hypothetical protein